MSRKKEIETTLSLEEIQQIEQQLAHCTQIAHTLQASTAQEEVASALAPFNALAEKMQLALLKALAKENTQEAADVLAAINVFGINKEARKEARRSLIRLEATKVYPQWTPPSTQVSVLGVKTAHPPRFWRGCVTQAREQGEVTVLLTWEQGYDYEDVRAVMLVFNYWHEGVKDAWVEIVGKRRAKELLDEFSSRSPDVAAIDCTLAEGKRLLEEALSVNTWRGTMPHKDYRSHLPIIEGLILRAIESGEDRGQSFIAPQLTAEEVAANFIGAWSLGDYALTYDLLSRDNALTEGLSRDEWIARHRAWANEALPARVELDFIREREARQSALWLPTTLSNRSSSRKEIEIGWSVELTETPLGGTLREMPMGTAVNKETGRHWFWTSYILVQEEEQWRIQRFADEGASVQGLAIPELQQRVQKFAQEIEENAQKYNKDVQQFLAEVPWRLVQRLHYSDALITRLPLDRQVCEEAYNSAVMLGHPERTMVYLERMADRFLEYRADTLRRLGATQITYAYSDRVQQMPDRQQRFLTLGEETLRAAIELDQAPAGYILLAELYLSMQRNDEAEVELQKALALQPGPGDEASIEAGLGNVAMRRGRTEEALPHFQRVAALDATYSGIWFNIGFAHRLLERYQDAEAAYQRALQLDPQDIRVYAELIAINMQRGDKQTARLFAEQGVQANPDAAELHALLASVLFEMGDQLNAQRALEKAESIDPEAEMVRHVRQYIRTSGRKR